MSQLVFWVFSYNRGNFLQHCIASIEQCAPGCAIRIFDDRSPDPETRQILEDLSGRHSVHYPADSGAQSKHGGLYANMQAALTLSGDEELVCFLQDDMQLVRTVTPEDIQRLEHFFATAAKPCFMRPTFLHHRNPVKDKRLTRYDLERRVYYVDRFKNSAGAFYSDVCLFRPKDLRAVGWAFVPREANNERQARERLAQMAYWRDPFASWLPNVPAFRGKARTWALRMAEKKRRCGFYPLAYMTPEQTQAFLLRDDQTLPYAEDFLQVRDGDLPKPWIYYPLQGSRWLKRLNNVEVKLRKLMGR